MVPPTSKMVQRESGLATFPKKGRHGEITALNLSLKIGEKDREFSLM